MSAAIRVPPEIGDGDILDCLTGNRLHLILMPTEACNFRCVYCYEDFRYSRMEPGVVQGIKNLLTSRAAELDEVFVSWFGGEPLLARDIIEEILLHARSLAAAYPGMQLGSDITTNAYLLSRGVFGRLLDLGVTRYQISFDGPREWHDRKRVLADGRGTFDRIWENLVAMLDEQREFTVLVRLHADRENLGALPEYIEQFDRTFGKDRRFRLFMRPLSRLGGPNDRRLPVLGAEEGARAVEALSHRAEERGLKPMSADEFGTICYASRANSFLVRADGRLNKCTVALEHPMNQVGRLREDGRVEVAAPRMRMWMRGLSSREPDELECPMIGLADPSSVTSVSGAA